MPTVLIRPLQPSDNAPLANIIRSTLKEFGANHPGTVYFDSSTDHLSDLFTMPHSVYHVVEVDGKLAGGAGIYPTAGLPTHTCELVKMYLSAQFRGLGIGNRLMEHCLASAATNGFKQVYLETMPELIFAIPMYQKFGFKELAGALGDTGHHGCNIWMLKTL